MTQETPLSVSELTDRIKTILEDHFFTVSIEGEIGHINMHRSGHVYCSLKDESARIDAVIWRSTVARLQYRPQAGELVIATGRLSVYAPHGAYKLVINRLEPAGLGRLQAEFERCRQRLLEEGLFSQEHKKALPRLPRGVGVITSATGAARRDIESVIQRRSPQIPIYLYPANVQGPSAVSDIIDGIKTLDRHPDVDVIIAGRGGGSLEDLWSFNDERLARAIFACATPIISAVGHETDTTISDMVADVRAPTPSAAAELAVPQRDDLLFTLSDATDRLQRVIEGLIRSLRQSLIAEAALLRHGIELNPKRLALTSLLTQMERKMTRKVSMESSRLKGMGGQLNRLNPQRRLIVKRKSLDSSVSLIRSKVERKYQSSRLDFGRLVERLDALSPLGVLARGYSLTTQGGKVLMSTRNSQIGDRINVRLAEGSFDAKIETIYENVQREKA